MVMYLIDRYGLPVNFQAMLLQPNKKNMKKLREVLNDLYKHLDSSAAVIDVSNDLYLDSSAAVIDVSNDLYKHLYSSAAVIDEWRRSVVSGLLFKLV